MEKEDKNVVVSIICNAYNHERYIRDALEGFVKQKTNYAFEVLIHDDASTDHTADIIREYEKNYPDIIKPIYQTENKYSQHIPINRTYQHSRVQGKYVALCEGDDYWTDPYKLQKQTDFLEKNPKTSICSHRVKRVREGKCLGYVAPRNRDCIIPVEDVILGGGSFVATNSLMLRAECYKKFLPFREILNFDYVIQIQGALDGGMGYLNDCMGCYRVGTPGSWTRSVTSNIDKYVAFIEKIKMMLVELDKDTKGAYSTSIEKRIRMYDYDVLNIRGKYKEMLKKQYRDLFFSLSLKRKLKVLVFSMLSKKSGDN